MHVRIDRRTTGMTRWGIFQNLTNRADRMTGAGPTLPLGLWYLHVHTPWLVIQLYATTDGPSLTYLSATRRYAFSPRTFEGTAL